MRQLLLILACFSLQLGAFGQGAGFGYQMDFGSKSNFNVGEGYSQSMQTFNNSFFVRWHSNQGRRSHQIVTGLRFDSIGFTNRTEYFSEDGGTTNFYNVDASLHRVAWRMGYLEHRNIIGKPGGFVVSFNYGLYYEFTSQMKRRSLYDDIQYKLYSEQNRHNLVGSVGIEVRFWMATVGYKYEHMFFDMINHSYVNQQTHSPANSSELRGLDLSPSMGMFYVAINFDFFNPSAE